MGKLSWSWEPGRWRPIRAGKCDRMYGPDGSCFVVAWNKLYRRELFPGNPLSGGRIHEDEATTYRIYDRVKKAAVVDSTRYGYFINADSITRSFSPRRLDWIRAVSERMVS